MPAPLQAAQLRQRRAHAGIQHGDGAGLGRQQRRARVGVWAQTPATGQGEAGQE